MILLSLRIIILAVIVFSLSLSFYILRKANFSRIKVLTKLLFYSVLFIGAYYIVRVLIEIFNPALTLNLIFYYTLLQVFGVVVAVYTAVEFYRYSKVFGLKKR